MSDPITFHISPYGSASSALKEIVEQDPPYADWLRAALRQRHSGRRENQSKIWVAFSHDLDDEFVKLFLEQSTPETRLLVMNEVGERSSTDNIFTRLMEMQIRSTQRFYVADWPRSGTTQMSRYLAAFMQRLAATSSSDEHSPRILNASVFAGVLHVVSPEFKRLEIPIAQIPALADKPQAELNEFEIDEDGAFIYWPKLDVHLGWEQLEQIINPTAALKALQKQTAFNIRYGKAVQKFREQSGIKPADLTDLSVKQLGRIERGECRLTSSAIATLAKAHNLSPNEYLNKLAEKLSEAPSPALGTVISRSFHFMPKPRKVGAR